MTPPDPAEFLEFPKIARFNRDVIITEKIDGTNAQIFVWDERHPVVMAGATEPAGPRPELPWIWSTQHISIAAGSRTRWITPSNDNHGFARWVQDNGELLRKLGHGRHFGEWWGSGIQRGYGLSKGEKRFSLFNVMRWCLHGTEPKPIPSPDPRVVKMQDVLPPGCFLVPELYRGPMNFPIIAAAVADLREHGSQAAPGFMDPEGIVIFHTAAQQGFKITLKNDDLPKSLV